MAHHYNTSVYFRDLPDLRARRIHEFAKHKASVFTKISIVELSIYVLLGIWDKLADHFVDYSESLTKDDIIKLLKTRAQRVEMSFEQYQQYLATRTASAAPKSQ